MSELLLHFDLRKHYRSLLVNGKTPSMAIC